MDIIAQWVVVAALCIATVISTIAGQQYAAKRMREWYQQLWAANEQVVVKPERTHQHHYRDTSNMTSLFDLFHINWNNDSAHKARLISFIDRILIVELAVVFAQPAYAVPFWTLWSLLMLVRLVCFCVTILPKCSTMPSKPHYEHMNVMQIMWQYAVGNDPHTGHENDLMFSGHAMVFALCMHHWTQTGLLSFALQPVPFVLVLLTQLFCSFGIIVTRCHYTIDVIMAWIVTGYAFNCLSPHLY